MVTVIEGGAVASGAQTIVGEAGALAGRHFSSGGERGGEGGGRGRGGGGARSLPTLRGRLATGGESGGEFSSSPPPLSMAAALLLRALTLLRWFWNQICTERSFMPSSVARRARAGPSGAGAAAKAAHRPSSCEGQILVRP
eukprot:scaffold46054_cov54-Phaeocystis_antarctica.AAC.2